MLYENGNRIKHCNVKLFVQVPIESKGERYSLINGFIDKKNQLWLNAEEVGNFLCCDPICIVNSIKGIEDYDEYVCCLKDWLDEIEIKEADFVSAAYLSECCEEYLKLFRDCLYSLKSGMDRTVAEFSKAKHR